MSDLRIQVCEWLGLTKESLGSDWDKLPELTLDLCHEAEAKLTDEEHEKFQSYLWDVTEPKGVRAADVLDGSNLLDQWERARTSPTAEQRATALLRAVKEKGTA